MRIAISGAQCVGKTTLLKGIHIDGYEKKTEIVRSLDVPINKKGTFESQLQIMMAHGLTVQQNNIISDRSIVDSFVYGLWSYIHGKFTDDQYDLMEATFKAILPWYNLHFYIAPEFEMKEDGVRDTDVLYQTEIHNLFELVFNKYEIKVNSLSGSKEDRRVVFHNIVARYL